MLLRTLESNVRKASPYKAWNLAITREVEPLCRKHGMALHITQLNPDDMALTFEDSLREPGAFSPIHFSPIVLTIADFLKGSHPNMVKNSIEFLVLHELSHAAPRSQAASNATLSAKRFRKAGAGGNGRLKQAITNEAESFEKFANQIAVRNLLTKNGFGSQTHPGAREMLADKLSDYIIMNHLVSALDERGNMRDLLCNGRRGGLRKEEFFHVSTFGIQYEINNRFPFLDAGLREDMHFRTRKKMCDITDYLTRRERRSPSPSRTRP